MSHDSKPRNAQEALDAHLALIGTDIDRWLTLFADDATVEFPYATGTGLPPRLVGKEAIRDYFSRTPEVFKGLTFSNVRRYSTSDADLAISEAHGTATIATTSKPYAQDYVFFVHVRDGRIVRYREYWNPLAASESFGGTAHVAPSLGVK
ncbi:nuclear transport factor 2 family protein [Pyxidicoccus parkwayensis]|uniref:Nuclear transport factor 2 family protein n=1 Tax=Pyxidicoccus parkwayensis TaxID=2813578 RepID=A0ABX7NU53_9BACT|nr:nuclear transport factor 2 family protein [Pyxidicoccus parkwaysis]QSQ22409.1 nuclear transport factor 2 family protein [Pyxidicoccus parkwaysis]